MKVKAKQKRQQEKKTNNKKQDPNWNLRFGSWNLKKYHGSESKSDW